MAATTDVIRQHLALGLTRSRQLVEKTGLSQPTVSRALTELGDDIVRLGAVRSIQSALKDPARGFDDVIGASPKMAKTLDKGKWPLTRPFPLLRLGV